MSDDVQQRAAEVILGGHTLFASTAESIVAALAAANLLADPDTARLRRLGEAVEKIRADTYGSSQGWADYWRGCLDAIYREAGLSTLPDDR